MKYFLAVDGGGTKTQVICADEQGVVVGEGWSGSTNLTATTVGEASFNLQEAVRQAMQNLPDDAEVAMLSMGAAGLDTAQEIQTAEDVFRQALGHKTIGRILLVNDTLIALASGTDEADAVVLIAGTGSHCYGRLSNGQVAKTGGLDFLLTDDGSGYDIGRKILRAAVRSYDGRGPKTPLESSVCAHFQVPSISELKNVIYHPLLSKTEVAEVSRLMTPELMAHDPVTMEILDTACRDLSLMVTTVAKKLSLDQKRFPCVMVGGISRLLQIQAGMVKYITPVCPQITFVTPDKPPAYGALKLCFRK
jgi:N-acetylglucosamine kinase-like BadF-type ATPase